MDYEAKMKARAAAAAALAAANPWLVPVWSVKGGALIAAAKNIRIELARAFPGVKFSIKSRRFSMGDAIDVSWTDGPNSRQVDEIIDRYSAGSFDGMQDLYTYERSEAIRQKMREEFACGFEREHEDPDDFHDDDQPDTED